MNDKSRLKVLFLDSWTKGIHNFLPIAKGLAKEGIESLLVHRGSWGSQPEQPAEECINGLMCRDISYYQTRFVYSMLKKECPDVVLILTTNYIADRAVILAARALGIKSCFLMHGIRATGEEKELSRASAHEHLMRLRWQRIRKYVSYTVPNYFLSGLQSEPGFLFRPGPYRLIWNTFRKPSEYVLTPPPSPEMHCDMALVWANIYKELFCKDYGYPEDRVRVVGHPPLDAVFRLKKRAPKPERKHDFLDKMGILKEAKICVYFEDSFVEAGFKNWTAESRMDHLEEIAEICHQAGRLLVVKLHPVTDSSLLESHFRNDSRVVFIHNTDLPLLVYSCESVIAHISSTVNIAICLDKPVFVPRWGISLSVPDYFIKKGVSIACNTPAELAHNLHSPQGPNERNKVNISRYVEDFITMTDGRSIERIINFLVGLCSEQ